MMMQKKENREAVVLENQGQKIFGVIHRPLGRAKRRPAILLCHGLGGQKTGKHRLYVELAQRAAENGITALRIDFRGSGDSEGLLAEMTIESEVSDALTALDFLAQDSQVDSNSLGIFGRSLGGAVAVLAAQKSSKLKTIALWAPIFDGDQWREQWEAFMNNPNSIEKLVNGQSYSLAFFKELFALDMANILHELENVPLLHLHGNMDKEVLPQHAERYEAARTHVKNSKFIRLPKGDHDFSRREDQLFALEETLNWFKEYL